METSKGMQCMQNGPDHISGKDWELSLAREGMGNRWDI